MPFSRSTMPMQRVSPKETLEEKRKDANALLKIKIEILEKAETPSP